MLLRSNRFIWHFLILFLTILLAMFGMYHGLVKYQDYLDRVNPEVALDVGHLFKVNLFVIDLCVLVLVESLMILLFCRYTLPSISTASILIIVLLFLKDLPITNKLIMRLLSPFAANKYAFLNISDVIVLIMINTLVLTFLITVMLKEAEMKGFLAGRARQIPTDSLKMKDEGEQKTED